MHTSTQEIPQERGRFSVAAAAGRAWRAAVAAIGPTGRDVGPDPLAALLPAGAPRYLRKPWSAPDLARINTDDRVLVLGAGLAAVNAVAALDRQWHRGLIRLVSLEAVSAERLTALGAAERAEVWLGRVEGAAAYGDTFVVDILRHGRKLQWSERYDWIVDGT